MSEAIAIKQPSIRASVHSALFSVLRTFADVIEINIAVILTQKAQALFRIQYADVSSKLNA